MKTLLDCAPPGGWIERAYYVVMVKLNSSNVPHKAIFYTGFLNGDDGGPGGYSGLFNPTYEPPFNGLSSGKIHEMKVVCRIVEMDGLEGPK